MKTKFADVHKQSKFTCSAYLVAAGHLYDAVVMGGLQGEAVERGAGAGQAGVAGVHEDVEAVNTERGWGLGSIDSSCECEYNNPDSLGLTLNPTTIGLTRGHSRRDR